MIANPALCQIIYTSPIGQLGLSSNGEAITHVSFDKGNLRSKGKSDSIIKQAVTALDGYFEHGVMDNLPPLAFSGTVFQQKVWSVLQQIPLASSLTYAQVAKKISNHPRAVGGACRANPIVLFVPCHRVVSSSGLGGFSGEATGEWPRIKQWLLEHEASKVVKK